MTDCYSADAASTTATTSGRSLPDQGIATSGQPVPTTLPNASLVQLPDTSIKPEELGDGFFTVLSREGVSVDKVRHKRNGLVYARKTFAGCEEKDLELHLTIGTRARHVNIVKFLGAYVNDNKVNLITEYCDGGSLKDIARRMKELDAVVGEMIVGRIAEGVLEGLAYLHIQLERIHRNLKPSTILLSRDGSVKLGDMGELIESIATVHPETFIYLSPEYISGGEYNYTTDIWSMGISLLDFVQNRYPFTIGENILDLLLTIISSEESPALENIPEKGIIWSDDMSDFIRRMLIRDPRVRPTAREMQNHPWILNSSHQKVDMARWLRRVWGWTTPDKNSQKANGANPAKWEEDGNSHLLLD